MNPSLRDQILDPRRIKATRMRSKVEAEIRLFFLKQNFIECRTPLLVPSPGMEVHIKPFQVSQSPYYLPTSPEFAMKKLLVGGLEKIFQICSSFRNEPVSPQHQPEFTMLEFYQAHVGYEKIMELTEKLFEAIAIKLTGIAEIHYQGQTISLATPWPRLKIRDLFRSHCDIELAPNGAYIKLETMREHCKRLGLSTQESDTWDDLYFRIWLNFIEPKLPSDQAVIVDRFPASQSALAVKTTEADGSIWAKRFEFYIAGFELGNAFEELTDANEQEQRFINDMKTRSEIYGDSFPVSPIDQSFIEALKEGLPPSGGIAIGVDRMVMLFADESDIRYTNWLPY